MTPRPRRTRTPTRIATTPTVMTGTKPTTATTVLPGTTTAARQPRPRDNRNRGDRNASDNRNENRDTRTDDRDTRENDRNRDNQQGGQGDRNRRQRPSREERRRNREERRLREEQERAEEILNAPVQTGILDLLPDGYGFMRTSGYTPGPEDIYVSLSQVRKMALRKGDVITGKVRKARDNEKYWALLDVDSVNGLDPEAAKPAPPSTS